jgi:quinolinate synthase
MDLTEEINRMKEEKNAVILAHNYQAKEIQGLADLIGDSFELAKKSVDLDAETIVLAGVTFMAETVKILNPEKKVLIPSLDATCPMAQMLDNNSLIRAKREYPGAPLVLYVNTKAESKALADIIVTSSNAVKIVQNLSSDTIIFGPDRNLAFYVSKLTGKKVIPIPKNGCCYVHEMFAVKDVEKARVLHPEAKLLAHPECIPSVLERVDFIASTGGMIRRTLDGAEWVIFTERDMASRLRTLYPDKKFYPANENAFCKGMKKITLSSLYTSFEYQRYEINLPEKILERAKIPIERMMEASNSKGNS